MKKTTSIILILVMILSLAACASNKPTTGTNSGAPAQTGDTKKADGTVAQSVEAQSSEAPQTTGKAPEKELAAIENDECRIVITGFDKDDLFGFNVKATLENKSADKTYTFSVIDSAINGVEVSTLFAEDVAPGKKANTEVTLYDSTIEKYDIGEYTDVELTFRVYDSDNFLADDAACETVHIYPQGDGKTAKFAREPKESDNVIIDAGNVTVTVIGYEKDELWGYSVELLLENKTEDKVMFSADDVSVNGFMIDPYFAKTVYPGKCAFASMYFSEQTFKDNSIETVEEIEFKFRAYKGEDYFGDDLANEVVTLKP